MLLIFIFFQIEFNLNKNKNIHYFITKKSLLHQLVIPLILLIHITYQY